MSSRQELQAGRVAVLLGGKSAEREISLKTGRAAMRALSALGYEACAIDPARDLVARLSSVKPVAAFVALHGRFGEDGCVQGLLECLGIPYTGSGIAASAIAMDKALTKLLVSTAGVPTPEHTLVDRDEIQRGSPIELPFALPAVVKPVREGSSVGISIVREEEELVSALEAAGGLERPVLIERYVEGRELSVAVLEGEALGAIEIVPARPFYDYEAKYGPESGTRYLHPPPISPELEEELRRLSALVFDILGCNGVCRADFIIDGAGEPWFIEINTLPGMTETSLVPKIAAGVGISFEELCERLLLQARLKA